VQDSFELLEFRPNIRRQTAGPDTETNALPSARAFTTLRHGLECVPYGTETLFSSV